ncbi:MAG: DUF1015 domain-containing protein [Thermoanaerobaculia bacterium]|nr:DUF1015 domain-containing protein [Thermoanaerobaculia bacterium]
MAKLTPFRALRPTPQGAPLVSSVPYDVVSTAEARALAAGNPLSFLHVTRSEIDLPEETDVHSDAVYALARTNLDALRRAAPLETEAEPALYVYQLKMGNHTQTGVAGTWSVDEYENGRIKKHEKTRRDKEDDRTHHMCELRAQTGKVFLTYKASAKVDDIVTQVAACEPLFDFTAADGVAHTVWRASGADRDALVAAFAGIPELYIADGHHRAASAWRTRAEIAAGHSPHAPSPNAGSAENFLAVAFPDDQVQVLPYHRLVKDLQGKTAEHLLAELRERFAFVDGPPQPDHKGHVGLYLGGRWQTFVLPTFTGASPLENLDCNVLQENVLTPLLGIGDPRTDQRIDFVGGIRGTKELEKRVDAGEAAGAFAMFPVSVADLIAVSDAGQIMPPKSTWFEPKLRDGLLVHEI